MLSNYYITCATGFGIRYYINREEGICQVFGTCILMLTISNTAVADAAYFLFVIKTREVRIMVSSGIHILTCLYFSSLLWKTFTFSLSLTTSCSPLPPFLFNGSFWQWCCFVSMADIFFKLTIYTISMKTSIWM